MKWERKQNPKAIASITTDYAEQQDTIARSRGKCGSACPILRKELTMIANVTYQMDGKTLTREVDAADLDTIKNAVNQWRVITQRLRKTKITILSIVCS